MIVAEVGLNHLGNVELLKKYIFKINKTNVDAISFQVLSKKFFYENNLKKYYIPREKIMKLIFKYSKKKVGLIVDEVSHDIIKFKKRINFFKITGNQAHEIKYLESIKKISKMTYISNRNVNKKILSYLIKIASNNKKINIIHTQFNPKEKFAKLNEIKHLSQKLKKNPAFGLHCENKNIVFLSTFMKPESFFFYIKDDKKKSYPDNKWAIKLNEIDKYLSDINFFKKHTNQIRN